MQNDTESLKWECREYVLQIEDLIAALKQIQTLNSLGKTKKIADTINEVLCKHY
jgi:hypothetical protein